MGVERIIGIDFGTSTSVVRVKRYSNGQPVDDRLSKQDVIFNGDRPMVPTLIQRTDKGTYYGYDALTFKKGETLFQNFKVNLESPDPAQRQEARGLTEEFFTYMAREYRSQSEGGHFGDPGDTERTIVSYPVKWSDETKAFMIRAAEKAGFKNVEGMDEAQAAIHAVTVQSGDYLAKHGFFTAGVPCNILLMDMGAGTTDLVLCRHTPGNPPKNEMICTWPQGGDTLFGGREVDEILREYIRSLLPEGQADAVLKKNGMKEFKTWKETVVSPALARNETAEEFSSIDNIVDLLDIDMEPYDLGRSRFEKLAEEYLQEFPKLIVGCIDNSGIGKEDIDLVILTGGHSQWYFVKEMLSDSAKVDLPKMRQNSDRIIPITRPQETVALGMVYRPLSVEFQGAKNPDVENVKSVYERGGSVQKEELYLDNSNINTEKDDIAGYYQQKIKSMVVELRDCLVALKPDGTVVEFEPGKGEASLFSLLKKWNNIVAISGTGGNVIGITQGGTIFLFDPGTIKGGVKYWNNIVYISHSVGLKKDGTVVATSDKYGKYYVQSWRDIVSISCSYFHAVGLKKDGTVVATGDNEYGQCNVQSWRDIVSISCSSSHTVGLKKDGTVVATGNNEYGQCNVQDWRDIVAGSIYSERGSTIGLKKDGTVIVAGNNEKINVQNWKDIISISYSGIHVVGLKKDGTVIATGSNERGQCNVQDWKNIIAIHALSRRTYGISSDGKIIYTDFKKRTYKTGGFLTAKEHVEFIPAGSKTLPWKIF